ncbi:DUF697 domain-containing protein [Actinomycetospora sp. OC33-EN08]|uniref:DUF697 domain-containing protein n=1 Tax=Actinomycetospora aurantiaca TaxID=3129233 RepID=A0ABU8ML86_9PSEU
MPVDPREIARERIEAAVAQKKDRNTKADAAIWAAVALNTGLGAVPFGVNIWTFLGVTSVLVVALGAIYGHSVSHEGAGKIIKQIFMSVGATTLALTIGMKFFVEVMKGAGVITMGGATAAGMALDAVLCGAVTYAIGFTSKKYFQQDQQMSPQQMKAEFNRSFDEGKSKVREARGN